VHEISDLAQSLDLAIEEETQRAANEALTAWIPRAIILVPVFAWLLWMVRAAPDGTTRTT